MHFEFVFNRISCIGLWYFCSVSHDSSLYCCRNSYFCFPKIYVWLIHLFTKSSLCVGWSAFPSHMGWSTLGWSAFIRCAVLLSHLVKQDGWLREEVFVCWKSESIWFGEMSQQPFKVEITPHVLILLCLIGVCLFLGDFCTFSAVSS